jgi:hypothetical protein
LAWVRENQTSFGCVCVCVGGGGGGSIFQICFVCTESDHHAIFISVS